MRIGYVGELGWELHTPTEFALHVYDLLAEKGATHGIRDIGYRAIDSLRMEKGYLYWSADITPDYTPVEAGLGFRMHLKSKGDFTGRAVLEAQKSGGTAQKLCCFTSDKVLPLFGGETILLGETAVSLVTSTAFGHTVGQTILFGYLPCETAEKPVSRSKPLAPDTLSNKPKGHFMTRKTPVSKLKETLCRKTKTPSTLRSLTYLNSLIWKERRIKQPV